MKPENLNATDGVRVGVPHDFTTHRAAWRNAINLWITNAGGEDERTYWQHELRAFDRAFDELLATPGVKADSATCPSCGVFRDAYGHLNHYKGCAAGVQEGRK